MAKMTGAKRSLTEADFAGYATQRSVVAPAPTQRRRAMTRCVPKRDSVKTQAGPHGNFCLDFARGCCPDGSECTHRHEIPRGDEVDGVYDIFGRKRALREGGDDIENVSLEVSNLKPMQRERSELCGGNSARSSRGLLDEAVRKAFGAFGEIYETRVTVDAKRKKATAIVAFKYRANAEFALEAMMGQGLTQHSAETLQVKWADSSVSINPPPSVVAAPSHSQEKEKKIEWVPVLDAASGKHYYVDYSTGATTWTPPLPASESSERESEWIEYKDANSGESYWANTKTRETTWTKPVQ